MNDALQQPSAQLKRQLEAVLMVVEEPVAVEQLAQATQATQHQVLETLRILREEYTDRGFELREVAGGWRIYSREEHAEVLARFMVNGATTKLSPAASEALAVIAYLQPTTRSRVAAIRGVNSDSVVKSLHARGLITDVGHEEYSQAVLYATTPYFLELLGLDSIDQLPKLSPLLPGLADLPEFNDDPFQL